MSKNPILYWPYKTNGNADYQLSRKVINNETGLMPEVILDDLDLSSILSSLVYYLARLLHFYLIK